MKQHRHPAEGTRPSRALVQRTGRGNLNQVYLPQVGSEALSVYTADHPDQRTGSRLRWLVSTLMAASVGLLAIGAAVFGSLDSDRSEGFLASIEHSIGRAMTPPNIVPVPQAAVAAKSDRLTAVTKGTKTLRLIQDQVQERRNGKDFITVKSYGRLASQLAGLATDTSGQFPAFDPVALYGNTPGGGGPGGTEGQSAGSAVVSVRDPDNGVLPNQDGLEMKPAELIEAVMQDRLAASEDGTMQDGGGSGDAGGATGAEGDTAALATIPPEPLPPNTVAIAKTTPDDATASALDHPTRILTARAGDTLSSLLARNGVDPASARAVVAAALKVVDGEGLVGNQHLRLAASPGTNGKLVPEEVSLMAADGSLIVAIKRSKQGSFVAAPQSDQSAIENDNADAAGERASLYNSLFSAALADGLAQNTILAMVRTFAYDTDFRRPVGPGDGFEVFYDIAGDEKSARGAMPGHPDQLLFAALTVGGETRKFYRFRTPDGLVDYYDANGNDAKKFLMQRPVRGDVRFTSGFGMRMHPLLGTKRMHTGIDWAGPIGTPILAAGNGIIQEIGHKGGNGNYIRIAHANGYETAYSHMLKFSPGLSRGSKVVQGQVIGYIGLTGITNGPHLHFEILINSNFVDPMTITVPHDRQLTGRLLADFQREKAHIEELMNRAPVATLVDQDNNKG